MSEWIPIKTRPMTDEEYKELLEYDSAISKEDVPMFDCEMPEDGQEILISLEGSCVECDTCYIDCISGFNSYGLEKMGDWSGVTAWMPMPEPYEEGT